MKISRNQQVRIIQAVLAGFFLASPPFIYADRPPTREEIDTYACPMHPYMRVKASHCPKCNMRMIPLYTENGMTFGAGAHQDHEQKHGGLLTMTGDYHLEFLELENEMDIYLYDAFTKPLPVDGVTGEMHYLLDRESGRYSEAVPLIANEQQGFLAAKKTPGTQPWEVSVIVAYKGTELQVNCPLRITFEGWIVDLSCYLDKGIAAIDDVDCNRHGFSAGLPPALIVGDLRNPTVYLLSDRVKRGSPRSANARLKPLAGHKAKITGRILRRRQFQMLEIIEVAPAPPNPNDESASEKVKAMTLQ